MRGRQLASPRQRKLARAGLSSGGGVHGRRGSVLPPGTRRGRGRLAGGGPRATSRSSARPLPPLDSQDLLGQEVGIRRQVTSLCKHLSFQAHQVVK